MVGKNENLIFHEYFFNMEISLTIPHKAFRFKTCIHEIQMEGSMFQNSELGPSFYSMKC